MCFRFWEVGGETVVFLGYLVILLAVLVFAPKGIRHPPAGDAGHSSLPRQRRLTRRKPTLPGAEQSRALGVLVSSYGHSSAGICRYRFEGPRRCQFPGCVVRPPVAEPLPTHPSAGTGRWVSGQGFRYRGPYHASRKLAASWPFKPVPADASRTVAVRRNQHP